VDVYVLDNCTGDGGGGPEAGRQAGRKLAEALQRQLGDAVKVG